MSKDSKKEGCPKIVKKRMSKDSKKEGCPKIVKNCLLTFVARSNNSFKRKISSYKLFTYKSYIKKQQNTLKWTNPQGVICH